MAGSSQGHSIVMLSFTFLSLFFQPYKDTHFHEALPRGMGKQKCVLSVRWRGGGSRVRSGLRLEHEIVRREAPWLA